MSWLFCTCEVSLIQQDSDKPDSRGLRRKCLSVELRKNDQGKDRFQRTEEEENKKTTFYFCTLKADFLYTGKSGKEMMSGIHVLIGIVCVKIEIK